MIIHSSILAWEIPQTEEGGRLHGVAGVGHNLVTKPPPRCGKGERRMDLPVNYLLTTHLSVQRRQWHPTPVLLPGKSHGRRRLVGCSPWGR